MSFSASLSENSLPFSPLPIPSILVAKFSICSLNYCPWSRKDGNQPVLSGVWFRPNLSTSHPPSTDGGLAPAGNTSTLWICCNSVVRGNIFYMMVTFFPMIILKFISGALFPFSWMPIIVNTSNGLKNQHSSATNKHCEMNNGTIMTLCNKLKKKKHLNWYRKHILIMSRQFFWRNMFHVNNFGHVINIFVLFITGYRSFSISCLFS